MIDGDSLDSLKDRKRKACRDRYRGYTHTAVIVGATSCPFPLDSEVRAARLGWQKNEKERVAKVKWKWNGMDCCSTRSERDKCYRAWNAQTLGAECYEYSHSQQHDQNGGRPSNCGHRLDFARLVG